MTDPVTMFCAVIAYTTDAQRDWLLTEFRKYEYDYCEICGEAKDTHGLIRTAETEPHAFTREEDVKSYIVTTHDGYLTVYSEDNEPIYGVADVVARYQIHFQIMEAWASEQAHFAFDPRPNAFSGDAVFVFKGKITRVNPYETLLELNRHALTDGVMRAWRNDKEYFSYQRTRPQRETLTCPYQVIRDTFGDPYMNGASLHADTQDLAAEIFPENVALSDVCWHIVGVHRRESVWIWNERNGPVTKNAPSIHAIGHYALAATDATFLAECVTALQLTHRRLFPHGGVTLRHTLT